MGTFKENKINYQLEYSTLRKALGKRGCNYEKLSEAAGTLYLNCKDEFWSKNLRLLLEEITQREMMARLHGLI